MQEPIITIGLDRYRQLFRILGPGLLLASTSIGTSHLVLATRAGAHYGVVFFGIILLTLFLKYPLFEFGPRYTAATGKSLLNGYADQGKWAVWLFVLIMVLDMFAVTGAITAVCAGLLTSIIDLKISVTMLSALILMLTTGLLGFGKFRGLSIVIKGISLLLFLSLLVAFVATIIHGPNIPLAEHGWHISDLSGGVGLALTIGLIGFMPTGLEVSTLHSIWSEEQIRVLGCRPTLGEVLWDFKVGYAFTIVTGLMFALMGAYVVYGSGQRLEGSSTDFSISLLEIFTRRVGAWLYPILAIAAFGTIYGTLVSIMDGFARGFISGIQSLTSKGVLPMLPVLVLQALGAFLMLAYFQGGMVKILDLVTILVFLTAPVIGILNLRVIQSAEVPPSFRPGHTLTFLAYVGNVAMVVIAIYYLVDLF